MYNEKDMFKIQKHEINLMMTIVVPKSKHDFSREFEHFFAFLFFIRIICYTLEQYIYLIDTNSIREITI